MKRTEDGASLPRTKRQILKAIKEVFISPLRAELTAEIHENDDRTAYALITSEDPDDSDEELKTDEFESIHELLGLLEEMEIEAIAI